MAFYEILGSIGIGAIVVKILDVWWLQKIMYNNDKQRWVLDKKFDIFSKISNDLISGKGWSDGNITAERLELISNVFLFASDEGVAKELDSFYRNTKISLSQSDGRFQEARNHGCDSLLAEARRVHEEEHIKYQFLARKIVLMLKNDMLG